MVPDTFQTKHTIIPIDLEPDAQNLRNNVTLFVANQETLDWLREDLR